jgi:hypothetical protein
MISWRNAREKKFGLTSSPVSNLSNSVKTPPYVTVHTHAVRKQTEARKFPLCSQQIELMSSGWWTSSDLCNKRQVRVYIKYVDRPSNKLLDLGWNLTFFTPSRVLNITPFRFHKAVTSLVRLGQSKSVVEWKSNDSTVILCPFKQSKDFEIWKWNN